MHTTIRTLALPSNQDLAKGSVLAAHVVPNHIQLHVFCSDPPLNTQMRGGGGHNLPLHPTPVIHYTLFIIWGGISTLTSLIPSCSDS